jgi:DNA-binding IclR family transcriptional regulator
LVASGFLIRTPSSSYRLGPKLMSLGKIYENTNSLISISRPIMRELAAQTGESVALFTNEGDKCLCVAREFGHARLVFSIQEGDYMQLHATAAGRIFLAYGPEELREEFLNNPNLEKFTPSTLVDPQKLREELAAIRKRDYAINREEREAGIAAIASPLFDHENKVHAALAVVGPAQRFSDERCVDIVKNLLMSTRKISELLGASN